MKSRATSFLSRPAREQTGSVLLNAFVGFIVGLAGGWLKSWAVQGTAPSLSQPVRCGCR